MATIEVPDEAVAKFLEAADEFSRVSDAFHGEDPETSLSDYEGADEDFKDAQFEFMETVIAALPKK